ncbi:MAG: ABC transporter substrate-binding protein [Elusimicrobia bacterium]|nr:ABC transporter substrate-binding protein [Elusimicrobiota bacterium]
MLKIFLLLSCLLQAAVKNPDTFIELKSGGDIDTLDPAWAFDTASDEVIMNVYEPLLGYKGTSIKEFIPVLSEKVPTVANGLISKDGKTYVFPIRQGVVFHGGQKLNCEDARYSVLRFMIMDRSGGGSWLMLEPIAGTNATRNDKGDYTLNAAELISRVACEGQNLKITLPKPYAPFLSVMAQWSYVISKDWAVTKGEWDGRPETVKNFNNPKKESSRLFEEMNGTGPFMLDRWERNIKQLTLTRHEQYWQGPAKLKRVVIKGVPEFATRKLMIASGDADFIDETGRQFEPQLEGLPGVKPLDYPYLRVEALYFTFRINPAGNTAIYSGKLDGNGIPPDFFTDKDIRKGFAYAFNYEAYIKEILRGKASRPSGCIPRELPGHNPKQTLYPYDPAKAKAHLQKAWGGQAWEKGFKFACYHDANNTGRQMACAVLKKEVEALNPKFNVEIRGIQWSTYLAEVRQQKLPMFKLGWVADYPDPHNFAYAFLHSEGNYPKRQGFGYPEWDKLIAQGNDEVDSKKREAIYHKIQAFAFEEVPQIYTDQPLAFRVVRDWVKGYQVNPIFHGVSFYPIYKQD